jgi:APA family basic amino acid/polyamine antiporter
MTEGKLKRVLPSRFVLAVTVGGVVGLGILRGPGEIAAVVPEPSLYLGLWLFGGLFVLLSTAVTAELVGMTPRSGGTYALIRHAYGPYAGFVIGWVDWLSFAGDIALKAVVIMEFVAILFPETAAWRTPLAVIVTTGFAAIQLRGISLGAVIQQIATAAIGLVVIGVVAGAVFCGGAGCRCHEYDAREQWPQPVEPGDRDDHFHVRRVALCLLL